MSQIDFNGFKDIFFCYWDIFSHKMFHTYIEMKICDFCVKNRTYLNNIDFHADLILQMAIFLNLFEYFTVTNKKTRKVLKHVLFEALVCKINIFTCFIASYYCLKKIKHMKSQSQTTLLSTFAIHFYFSNVSWFFMWIDFCEWNYQRYLA